MGAEVISLLVLLAVFLVALWRPVNMGAVALVAAFLMGTLYFGSSASDIADGFPATLLVTLVGVTFLFGLASANGTVDLVVAGAVRAVGGRLVLLPWVFFVLATLITAAGAVTAATNAILVPIGIAMAGRYRLNPLLVGLSIINGTNAGGFSPISVYYTIVAGGLTQAGVTVSPLPIFAATFAFNLALNVIAVTVLRGWRSPVDPPADVAADATTVGASTGRTVEAPIGRTEPAAPPMATSRAETGTAPAGASPVGTPPNGTPPSGTPDVEESGSGSHPPEEQRARRWGVEQQATILAFALVVLAALGFGAEIGFSALTAGVVLAVIFPGASSKAAASIAWPVVLLIGGIITYISLLQSNGIVDTIATAVGGVGQPLLAAFLLLLIAGLVSAFASTNAMFGVIVPLATPFLTSGSLPLLGFVIALCVAASAVDSSPFSTGGALIVASTTDERRTATFRGLMAWGMSMIVVAPVTAWAVFVLVPAL